MTTGKISYDAYLFHEGTHRGAWRLLGAHPEEREGAQGWRFRVWAPHARAVFVTGDFCLWSEDAHPLAKISDGLWEGFVPGLLQYDAYKFVLHTRDKRVLYKADPFAFHAETRPGTASKLYDLSGYEWGDDAWRAFRGKRGPGESPLHIYEVHLGSWRRGEDGALLSYREIAALLVPYVKRMGYTHIELLPVTEHPLDDSWGYQCTGYFAATARFGPPHALKYLVDLCHRAGVGVILDWVPGHFPKDGYGLVEFDGDYCYEYAEPWRMEHKGWGTRCFDFGKPEVRSFLISSALFWLEEFHMDGLRVDAVAYMLYRHYGRDNEYWEPNEHGGVEDLEAVEFLRQLNMAAFAADPGVLMIAEEATAWPLVTYPPHDGGLGFNLKWNMGWMNDMMRYCRTWFPDRCHHRNDLTFSLYYAFSEQYILPVSHDEVVHLKRSLLEKMPGTKGQKLAGVRVFHTYFLSHPGKKLTFMGAELGQEREWAFYQSLDWHLLEQDEHRALHGFFQEANAFYLETPALWELDFKEAGFEWLDCNDTQGSTVAFLRKGQDGAMLAVVCNFSDMPREEYRLGLPLPGNWRVAFCSDWVRFGGETEEAPWTLKTEPVPLWGREQSAPLHLPALSALVLLPEAPPGKPEK